VNAAEPEQVEPAQAEMVTLFEVQPIWVETETEVPPTDEVSVMHWPAEADSEVAPGVLQVASVQYLTVTAETVATAKMATRRRATRILIGRGRERGGMRSKKALEGRRQPNRKASRGKGAR